ncbi:hypothetical protein, partial [Pseudomonas viridiflava]|uniref:hypothetical protein n=1 Tax=Pseudomonas viridiflava TaxID=33069 RepID=UPI0019D2832D
MELQGFLKVLFQGRPLFRAVISAELGADDLISTDVQQNAAGVTANRLRQIRSGQRWKVQQKESRLR